MLVEEKTTEIEIFHFWVAGENMNDLFRNLLWEDQEPFEKVYRMMIKSFSGLSKELCIDILEGRKKFSGDTKNHKGLDLVEDGENIRTLSDLLEKRELELRLTKIEDDIIYRPQKYIDKYSCIVAKCVYEHLDRIEDIGKELIEYRGHWYDVLLNGCFWIDNPKDTAKMVAKYTTDSFVRNQEQFEEFVYKEYEKEINELREQKIPYNDLSDMQQSIIYRNARYSNSQSKVVNLDNEHPWITTKVRKFPLYEYLGETTFNRPKYIAKMNEYGSETEYSKIFKQQQRNLYGDKVIDKIVKDIKKDEEKEGKDYNYDLNPVKEITSGWEGFIDVEGKFYQTKPIGMSYWNDSANCHDDFACEYLSYNNVTDYEDEKDYMVYTLRWVVYGHLISNGNVHVERPEGKLTKAQEDTLMKLFELNSDDMKEYFEYIEERRF
jgi:hypothetical protein